MSVPKLVSHSHEPVFRVARARWPDPLDTSFSQSQSNRWNAKNGQAVLYTACSEAVARGIVQDIFKFSALALEDLRPDYWPVLVEINWAGEVVDMASAAGIADCGFDSAYPEGSDYSTSQPLAETWFRSGVEGVVCRSASLWRLGLLKGML